jgi:hypothetical protein
MKNITLAIDEKVLIKVRRAAARKDTTVNALVRDYLTRLVDQDDKAAKARQDLVKLAQESTWDPGPDWKWNREELYDRAGLRRLERPNLRSVDTTVRARKKSKGRRSSS